MSTKHYAAAPVLALLIAFAAIATAQAQPTVGLTTNTFYVKTPANGGSDTNDGLTPATAFATLGKALTEVFNSSGTLTVRDGIAIGPGTFAGTGLSISFPVELQIQGGWDNTFTTNDPTANVTTISGGGTNSVLIFAEGTQLLVHGLTITGGGGVTQGGGFRAIGTINGNRVTFQRVSFSSNSSTDDGGAFWVQNLENAVFDYCTFSGNTAADRGGVGQIDPGSADSSTIFSNCTFVNNQCVNRMFSLDDVVTFSMIDCTIQNNTQSGSEGRFFYLRGATNQFDVLFSGCTFSDQTFTNPTAGRRLIFLDPKGNVSNSLIVEKCTFEAVTLEDQNLIETQDLTVGGNSARSIIIRNNVFSNCNIGNPGNADALIYLGDATEQVQFVNNTIAGTTVQAGGDDDALVIIAQATASPIAQAVNNIFLNNTSNQGGGCIQVRNSGLWTAVTNNIFFGNQFEGNNRPGFLDVARTTPITLDGVLTGNGNFDLDPLLDSNLRLQIGSPAINTGANLPGLVDDDIDGDSRPAGGLTDIGADEGAGSVVPPPSLFFNTQVQEWILYN